VKPHLVVALVLAAGPALGAEPQVGRWAAELEDSGEAATR